MTSKFFASLLSKVAIVIGASCFVAFVAAADLKLIGTHPTSRLTAYPAINSLKSFERKIYMGYGDWDRFPAVTITSYDPIGRQFRIEHSLGSDAAGEFREIGGVLYHPSIDPGFYEKNRDYSYCLNGVWRDASPAGFLHVFDLATVDGSDLWMVGSKQITETATYNPAVFRSTDGGRNWEDLTIQSSLSEGRYWWGFPLRGRFYVRDTWYEGTNGTRIAPAQHINFTKATPAGQKEAEFVIGLAGKVPGGNALGHPLVTFDTTAWKTLRSGVVDFTVRETNLFTLESSRSIWMASSLTATQAVWQRLDLTNVPSGARCIEIMDDVVYVGDSSGRLWAAHLDGGVITTNPPAEVTIPMGDEFGRALAFGNNLLAVGAPDYSGAAPLSGQVSLWEQMASSAGADWQRIAVLDPPAPSFSGWFGKDVALWGNLLAVVEAGRDTTKSDRGASAQVHLYQREGTSWSPKTNLSIPFAQTVALDSGWLAVGASVSTQIPGTRVLLYQLSVSPDNMIARRATNIAVTAPFYFWKPSASIALRSNVCAIGSAGDVSFAGGPGEVKIYQRDGMDAWHLTETIRSPAPGLPITGDWRHDSATGVWRTDGEPGGLLTTSLTSPDQPINATGEVRLSFSHRWSFETGWDGGQVRVSINGGEFVPVQRSAFISTPYNGSVLSNSGSELHGQNAFVSESAGYATGARVNSICNLGLRQPGDSISVRFLYAADGAGRGTVPNWEIDSISLVQTNAGAGEATLLASDFNSSDAGFVTTFQTALPPDYFGCRIALTEDWLALGASRDDQAAWQAGAVHLYQRTNTIEGSVSFQLRQTILSPFPRAEARFGTSVALNDTTLLVGAPGVEFQRHHGATFVYKLEEGIWRNVGQIAAPEGSEGEFGTSVALGSDWFAASSRFSRNSPALTDRLALHRFNLSSAELEAKRLSAGNIGIHINGEIGRTYTLQRTSDITAPNWTGISAVTLTTPATNIIDPAVMDVPQRYYRVEQQ